MTRTVELLHCGELLLEKLEHFAGDVAPFGLGAIDEDVFNTKLVHLFFQLTAEVGMMNALARASVGRPA